MASSSIFALERNPTKEKETVQSRHFSDAATLLTNLLKQVRVSMMAYWSMSILKGNPRQDLKMKHTKYATFLDEV